MASRATKRPRRHPIDDGGGGAGAPRDARREETWEGNGEDRRGSQGGGGAPPLREQRASRLHRRREREAASGGAGAAAAAVAKRESGGSDDGGSGSPEAVGYTTAYATIVRKYPRHSKMMEWGGDGGAARSLNYQNHHRTERDSNRGLGMTLIRKRWKAQANENSGRRSDSGAKWVPPLLVHRRTHVDYSEARPYRHVAFLNARTVVALDSRGDLEIVGLPPEGRRVDEDADGAGTPLARMPVAPPGGQGPPGPCHLALFGYRNGDRLAVGLPSGRVQLFSSERTVPRGRGPREGPGRRPDHAGAAAAGAAWSRLPPSLGPRRRYRRNDAFPLASMLSPKKKGSLWRAFNDRTKFEELPGWDDASFSLRRPCARRPADAALWAFRDGGAALEGAFVDPESDCFSLRTVDERAGGASRSVFADEPSGHVMSVCFSGEHGLVTYHAVAPGGKVKEGVVKWWDRRMLCDRPVSVSSLVFPRDRVFGASPASERSVRPAPDDGGETGAWLQLRPRTDNRAGGSPPRAASGRNESLREHDVNLVGSNDFSDRFAVHRAGDGHRELAIVDSPRRQTVQSQRTDVHDSSVAPCFSGDLDLAAFHAGRGKGPGDGAGRRGERIAIYDISRRRHRAADGLNSYESPRGGERKRGGADDRGDENDRFLGSLRPQFTDMYGIESPLTCMSMDELGCSIACGTNDGDIYLLRGR